MNRNRAPEAGMTLVELIVAAAVAGVLLSLVAIFFAQNSDVTRRTQARHEVEAKAKAAAELVAQDLQLAGSRVIFNGGVTTELTMPCSAADPGLKCVESPSGGGGTLDDLTLYYATSLRPSTPCRRIDYQVTDDGLLQRSELAADAAGCADLDDETADFSDATLADGIAEFDIGFRCANDDPADDPSDDPADCYAAGSYPRAAIVRVLARASSNAEMTSEITLSTGTPNLRY